MYRPVIGRWCAGREWALANAFMDSFCKFFKTKADGYLQVQSALAVGSSFYYLFRFKIPVPVYLQQYS
jgi:hypothetical protein